MVQDEEQLNIRRLILDSLAARDEESSVCPSEIARLFAKNRSTPWREWMNTVRDVAAGLAREGQIVITRGSTDLLPDNLGGGPIRLRRGRRFSC
jgi:hypothetical protein